jgi:hypothetical protein
LSDAQAEVTVDAQKVALQFGKGRLDLVAPAIDAAAQIKGGVAEVSLRHLTVNAPQVAATAKFTWGETAGFALESETSDVDLPTLLSVGQRAAPDVDWLASFPVSFARGTATTVVQNAAKSRTSIRRRASPSRATSIGPSSPVQRQDLPGERCGSSEQGGPQQVQACRQAPLAATAAS